ncbi:m15 protein [Murid betaherpesvirus 1]|nr:m15 protein [Murid betaherpesvirus 1]
MYRRRHVGYLLLSALAVSLYGPAFTKNSCQNLPSSINSTPGVCTQTSASVMSRPRDGGYLLTCQLLPICIPAVWYVTWIVTSSTPFPDITSISDVDEYSGSGSIPKERPPRSSYQTNFYVTRNMVIEFIKFNSTNNSIPCYSGTWNNNSDTRDRTNQSLGVYFHPENGSITVSADSSIKSYEVTCDVTVCINSAATTSSRMQVPLTSPSGSKEPHAKPSITTRKDVTISPKTYSTTTTASTRPTTKKSYIATSHTKSHNIVAPSTTSYTEDEIVHSAVDEEFIFLHSGNVSLDPDSNILIISAISLLCIYLFI